MLLKRNIIKFLSFRKFYTTKAKLSANTIKRKQSNCANENADKTNIIAKKLMKQLKQTEFEVGDKISIIGMGQVGIACTVALLTKNITNNLCFVDANVNWAFGEWLDLVHGSVFLNNPCLENATDLNSTKNSRIIIVTAGARPKKGQTRLDVAQTTADIFYDLIPPLAKVSPKAIFIIVSNPADVMTWVAHKIGNLPVERCVSVGTHLDTARLRYLIAKRLNVAATMVNALVIGEHGNSSVNVWSSASVGGILLRELNPKIGYKDDPDKWYELHEEVTQSGPCVSNIKGYTNWAIGLATADVCSAFLKNSGRILPLTTDAKGFYDFDESVFLSLPCLCRGGGIAGVCELPLNDCELDLLRKSYEILHEAQCSIKFNK